MITMIKITQVLMEEIKRGRGRPRKDLLTPTLTKPEVSTTDLVPTDLAPDLGLDLQKDVLIKRGRGRPRKETVNNELVTPDLAFDPQDISQTVSQTKTEMIKRGRGRPRKEKVVDVQKPDLIKRGRGRPRKIKSLTIFKPKCITIFVPVLVSKGITIFAPNFEARWLIEYKLITNPITLYSQCNENYLDRLFADVIVEDSLNKEIIQIEDVALIVEDSLNKESLNKNIILIEDVALVFLTNSTTLLLDFESLLESNTPIELYTLMTNVLRLLQSTDSKGYLNSIDLRKLPLISDFINLLVLEKEETIIGDDGIEKVIKTRSLSHISGVHSMVTFKWLYNVLILNIFTLSVLLIHKIDSDEEGLKDSDFYADLLVLNRQLSNNLDTSIRRSLQKRGINVIQNIQTGFDTEYVNLTSLTNRLLSVQLATNTVTYLKIPKVNPYVISSVNPQTNSKYIIIKDNYLNNELIELSIDQCIKIIRGIKYSNMDESVKDLITRLQQVENIRCQEQEENFLFRLPQTVMKNLFHEVGDSGYSVSKLIDESQRLGLDDINQSYIDLIKLLKNQYVEETHERLLGSDSLKIEGAETEILEGSVIHDELIKGPSLVGELNDGDLDIGLVGGLEKTVSKKEVLRTDLCIKPVSRTFLPLYKEGRVSLTRVINIVLIGHLTPADLSVLSDFQELNEQIDIVNKGFVTLGKPIDFSDRRIILRDTTLLAPMGAKSLSSVGKLYNLEKFELDKEELQNMDILLKTNKEKFMEYAVEMLL